MSETCQPHSVTSKKIKLIKIGLFVIFVISINVAGSWLMHLINFQIFPRHDSMLNLLVIGAAGLYVMLMVIPFMPGIEIGLALMFLLGNKGALLIYLCTLLALSISYMMGRMLPPRLVVSVLNWFYLYRAGNLVSQLEPLEKQQRLKLLYENAPRKLVPLLLKHRYLAIAVILNIPGNALIGGGGGIGLIVGMSKLISYHVYLILLAVAVASVPLLFFFEII